LGCTFSHASSTILSIDAVWNSLLFMLLWKQTSVRESRNFVFEYGSKKLHLMPTSVMLINWHAV